LTFIPTVLQAKPRLNEAILKKGRKKNMARDVAICLARELTKERGKNLGEYFGSIAGAGITVRCNYMERKLEKNRQFKPRLNRLRKSIINNYDVTLIVFPTIFTYKSQEQTPLSG